MNLRGVSPYQQHRGLMAVFFLRSSYPICPFYRGKQFVEILHRRKLHPFKALCAVMIFAGRQFRVCLFCHRMSEGGSPKVVGKCV